MFNPRSPLKRSLKKLANIVFEFCTSINTHVTATSSTTFLRLAALFNARAVAQGAACMLACMLSCVANSLHNQNVIACINTTRCIKSQRYGCGAAVGKELASTLRSVTEATIVHEKGASACHPSMPTPHVNPFRTEIASIVCPPTSDNTHPPTPNMRLLVCNGIASGYLELRVMGGLSLEKETIT